MNVQSRTIEPQRVYEQWCQLFQQYYQSLRTQQQRQQAAPTAIRYDRSVQRKLEAMEWIDGELNRYTGAPFYPDFRQWCEYALKIFFTRHSLRRAVEEAIGTLHKKLALWVEAQFDTEYRYELHENPTYDGTWLIWDRHTQAIAHYQGHPMRPLSAHRARDWCAGFNGLAVCAQCKRWNPHECLPGQNIRCLVCRTKRALRSGD